MMSNQDRVVEVLLEDSPLSVFEIAERSSLDRIQVEVALGITDETVFTKDDIKNVIEMSRKASLNITQIEYVLSLLNRIENFQAVVSDRKLAFMLKDQLC